MEVSATTVYVTAAVVVVLIGWFVNKHSDTAGKKK